MSAIRRIREYIDRHYQPENTTHEHVYPHLWTEWSGTDIYDEGVNAGTADTLKDILNILNSEE